MESFLELRKSERFVHKTTVMLEDIQNGNLAYGQMINYSDGGMLIATSSVFQPGTKLSVSLSQPVYKAAPTTYRTVVRWCNEIATEYVDHDFGVGVRYA